MGLSDISNPGLFVDSSGMVSLDGEDIVLNEHYIFHQVGDLYVECDLVYVFESERGLLFYGEFLDGCDPDPYVVVSVSLFCKGNFLVEVVR